MHLHDSKTRQELPLKPVNPGKVGIYLCGATVQGAPHIGHVRSGLAFDVLVRWLRRSGYEVTLVRNVTDIDDKILAKSAEAGVDWFAWAYRFEREFTAGYRLLGCLPPTYEPRATGHMTEMVEFIERLIGAGHAYRGEGANVYFDVRSLPDYGALTNQSLDHLVVDEDDVASDKRDPLDFALWKAPKPTEPATASWPSPWGRGRPGWHLECSAMAKRYLGDTFDIHGGGIDLRFPHHENERAQSVAAGDGFANIWMHNAWVTIKGEKMSKSLGNSLLVSELLKQVPAYVLRLAFVTVHYRSTIEYSAETLTDASALAERFVGFIERAVQAAGRVDDQDVYDGELPQSFIDAMNDDLNVAAALAVIHEHVRIGNTALAEGNLPAVRAEQQTVRSMLDVLGLDPLSEQWAGEHTTVQSAADEAIKILVDDILEQRVAARADKDWAKADALRDQLARAGIVVEDGSKGARWHFERR